MAASGPDRTKWNPGFRATLAEMNALVVETERARQALGKVSYGPAESEKKSLVFRLSICVAEDIKAGEAFTANNLRIIRPGNGLPPKYLEVLLGKKADRVYSKGTPVTWDFLL